MINIKLSFNGGDWPLERQTPNSTGIWDGCKFFINQDNIASCDFWVVLDGLNQKETVRCPKQNTIFITMEPESIKKYTPKFLNQFDTIITSQRLIKHPWVIFNQQAQAWLVGAFYDVERRKFTSFKNYDELQNSHPTKNNNKISIITSGKTTTPGHRQRLEFVKRLKEHFKDQIDIFGSGINHIADKWDGIAPYKYCLSIENSSYADYWTEKLSDAFLGESYPFYYGCPNIYNYFPEKSLTVININNPEQAIKIISNQISNNMYDKRKNDILKAKDLILNKYNIFSMLSSLCKERLSGHNTPEQIVLWPEKDYFSYYKKARGMISGTLWKKN
ncbi:MAG: glycosyltransferase family 10 [Patescibacteria group bacterium]